MKTLLTQLADQAPTARVSPAALWRHGRRRRIRSRLAAVLVLFCVLAVPLAARPSLQVAEARGFPSRIDAPYLWQASWQSSPNGPAMAYFRAPLDVELLDDIMERWAVVGRDGSYRMLSPGGIHPVISPDGTRLAVEGRVLDLRTGVEHKFTDDPMAPLAWSRDSRLVLTSVRGSVDGSQRSGVYLFDTVSGTSRLLLGSSDPAGLPQAAFSPDGTKVAVSYSGQLKVLRIDDGSTMLGKGLPPGVGLADPAAWTPDGHSIALIAKQACYSGCERDALGVTVRWQLSYLNLSDPQLTIVEQPHPSRVGSPYAVTGWVGGDPVLAIYGGDDPDYSSSLARLKSDGTLETLAKVDTSWLQVPQDVIEQGRFGGAPRGPSPLSAQPWAYACLAVTLTMIGLPVLLIIRRSRTKARTIRGNANPHLPRQDWANDGS